MQLYTVASLLLIASILQVGAFPSDSEENATVEKWKSNVDPNREALHELTDISKSLNSLKHLYSGAKTSLNKLQTCRPGTHFEILKLAALKWGDFQGCVNATREIANYEEFLFHLFYYTKFVGGTFVNVTKDVINCYHEPGFFNILNCTVTQFQNSGPQFDIILSKAKDLIAEVENDTEYLILYIKRCIGYSSAAFLSEMHSIIKHNC